MVVRRIRIAETAVRICLGPLLNKKKNFMIDLDNLQKIKEIDKENLLYYIQDFPNQIDKAWQIGKNFILPTTYVNINKILILGMGGSGISGHLIKNLYQKEAKSIIEICQNYSIPSWVDKNTLVFGISFSGNTEETLAAFIAAHEKQAKLIAITTGGKLEELARKFKTPLLKFKYSSPPRHSTGYLFILIISLLKKLGIISIQEKDIKNALVILENMGTQLEPNIPETKNLAKKLAKKIHNFFPIIWTDDFTYPLGIRFKHMLNENAKILAFCEAFPELCHNSSVGLDYPKSILNKTIFIFLKSRFGHKRNLLRMEIMKEILQQKKVKYLEIELPSYENKLVELLTGILLIDYISFYSALLNNIDPTPTPNIEFLKRKLEN